LPAWVQALLILLAAAIPAGLWVPGGEASIPNNPRDNGTVPRVTFTQAMALDPVLWLDARPTAAFTRGHIPGALPLNEDAWETQLIEVLIAWNPGDTIVVYCSTAGCNTSSEVALRLVAETDFEPVLILDGGWEAYEAPGR